MRLIRGVAIGLALTCGAAPAMAQEKTPKAAYEFLVRTMTDGSWWGTSSLTCEDYSCVPSGGRQVVSLTYLNATYCQLQFGMREDRGMTYVRIDLARDYQVGVNIEQLLIIAGPVTTGDGTVWRDWQVKVPSMEIGQRVAVALTYLHGVCAPKSAF